MFERFTERARKIVVLSQEEARNFNHNYIGTEHLLLGLIREKDGIAGQVLLALGMTLERVRDQVEGIVGYGEEDSGGRAPFTPRSKKVLELALREALNLGHNYIGTEHILLGLLREGEGVANRVLDNLGVGPDRVWREVVRRLGEAAASGHGDADEPAVSGPGYQGLAIEARVTGLEVEVRYGQEQQPRKLLVDLEYDYDGVGASDEGASPSPEKLASDLVDHFAGRHPSSLAEAVSQAGDYVVDRVPSVVKLVVTATDPRAGENPPVSGLSVKGTFLV